MPVIIQQLGIVIFFGLFALGLGSTAEVLLADRQRPSANQQTKLEPQHGKGLHLVFAVVIYSFFCNALLLVPVLLQGLGLPRTWMPQLHQLALGICLALCLGLALIGILALLRRHGIVRIGWLRHHPISAPTDLAMISLAISVGTYLIMSQLNAVSYDLGLYHLPYVNHIVKFGPEIGLANLHSRFGFYNVQFYGQAPWQLLAGQPTLISPSLNIIFFSALLLHFIPGILHALRRKSRGSTPQIGSLILFTLAISVGLPNLGSIAGFDADFALSIASLITIDSIYHRSSTENQVFNVATCVLLPLIKFSGILAVISVAAFLSCNLALEKLFNSSPISPPPNKSEPLTPTPYSHAQPLRSTRLVFAMIAAAWLCMASTNIVQSGYPLFPNTILGPIGNHAVSRAGAVDLLDRHVRAYARFNDDNAGILNGRIRADAPLSQWLPPFLRSDRGKLMIAWGSSALFASLMGLSCLLFERKNDSRFRHTSLSITTLAMVGLVLLVLPPNPRFYSWLGALAFFVGLDILSKRPLSALAAASLVATGIAARGHRPLLGIVGQPSYSKQVQQLRALHGWSPIQPADRGEINRPVQGDQCWGIPSPCSPYRAALEDGKAGNLMR
jgi:hypothetical protein